MDFTIAVTYLSKTKSALESMSQDFDIFKSRKKFVDTYNLMMTDTYVKGAHKN